MLRTYRINIDTLKVHYPWAKYGIMDDDVGRVIGVCRDRNEADEQVKWFHRHTLQNVRIIEIL